MSGRVHEINMAVFW